MSKIKIHSKSGWGDCEDCGPYNWEDVTVYVDDVEVLKHYGDNHLEDGVWYDWEKAVSEVLEAVGHEVELVEEDVDNEY